MSKVTTAAQAVGRIRDGQTVGCTGVIGWITPDALLRALGERHAATSAPHGLTFFFTCATGDALGIPGMDHVARAGLMKRIVSGSYVNPRDPATGERPALTGLIRADRIEAYNWPIGAAMHWLREVARKGPGHLTRIGLGTHADPRHGGGRLTDRARDDLVELVEFQGQEYLYYPTWNLDVGLIRATSADEDGNLSFEGQPLLSSCLALALAVKSCGGRVIAQVDRVVPRGSRAAGEVRIPAPLVDDVVVAEGEPVGTGVGRDPGYLRPVADPAALVPRLPSGIDKVVARRTAAELREGETAIFGFGNSSDAVLALAEDVPDAADRFLFTTEHGSFGGLVMGGWRFSANYGPTALLDGPAQFDFIDAGLCRFAALAFAQFDAEGRVNVTRFGEANPGAGGFPHIADRARRLVFAGTFSTGGLKAECGGGALRIVREGDIAKFVSAVDHTTYHAGEGVRRGQEARVVTERAVFDLTRDGLVLVETAPGVDVRADILGRMPFPVAVARDVAPMDPALFR
ncbi:CoA-transferase [Actinocorallia sp. A-T 12471]|uniref:CoA-transferase n=1 Tax=Actinocorallia sp. A-T 12471 TaxID=3089813 RepID=UPI0029CD4EC0|nr:CoA-transferase [Actinocorallia sp. A-T 12471]MDX6741590.1 CoA-transferase [Actinocorallia sp. A-T 12471]